MFDMCTSHHRLCLFEAELFELLDDGGTSSRSLLLFDLLELHFHRLNLLHALRLKESPASTLTMGWDLALGGAR